MSRATITVHSPEDRVKARDWCMGSPLGTRITFQARKRSVEQNDRLWLLLDRVSRQLLWHGQRYGSAEWKDYFMHAYRGEKWMPAEDGGMVPIGRATSNLSKDEFGELMALIEAFCARHDVSLPWEVVA